MRNCDHPFARREICARQKGLNTETRSHREELATDGYRWIERGGKRASQEIGDSKAQASSLRTQAFFRHGGPRRTTERGEEGVRG